MSVRLLQGSRSKSCAENGMIDTDPDTKSIRENDWQVRKWSSSRREAVLLLGLCWMMKGFLHHWLTINHVKPCGNKHSLLVFWQQSAVLHRSMRWHQAELNPIRPVTNGDTGTVPHTHYLLTIQFVWWICVSIQCLTMTMVKHWMSSLPSFYSWRRSIWFNMF